MIATRNTRHFEGLDVPMINPWELEFLMSPPGNHLEALKGGRKDQHSIRINDQWRVCFRWTAAGPEDVEIAAKCCVRTSCGPRA